LKAPRSAGEIGAVNAKRVATAKTGTEAVVGNPTMARHRLCSVSLLLSLRWPSLLLGAWLLLRRFRLLPGALLPLRWLSLLLSAWLLLRRFRLLPDALLPLRWLSLLLSAWLLLRWLSLLLGAWLLLRRFSLLLGAWLLLRRFGLLRLLLGLLLLLAPLCVDWSNGSGKQKQTCYSQNTDYLH
jgi:hypothetical protein